MKAVEGGLTLVNAIKIGREYTAAIEHMKEAGKELNGGKHKLFTSAMTNQRGPNRMPSLRDRTEA